MEQQEPKEKAPQAKISVCLSCVHACDGRRCGWVETLRPENLPRGAEYTIARIDKTKRYRKEAKTYYQIKSCPQFKKGVDHTPPQEPNAIKLAEAMLYKLSESYEDALISNDRTAIDECEYCIKHNWIWDVLWQSGLMETTPDTVIEVIRSRVHDARSVTVLTDWLNQRLNSVKPELIKSYITALEHYRDTDASDVASTKRLIKDLKTRIENTRPKNYTTVKTQICDNAITKLKSNKTKITKKPKEQKSFVAHREKVETIPDTIQIWLMETTMYLNLMC